MPLKVIVAFRMPPESQALGARAPLPTLLVRSKSLCERGEALGAQRVSWTPTGLVLAWNADSFKAAVLLAASIREEAMTPERGWAVGIVEAELAAADGEAPAALDGALALAASLARIANASEVLLDGEVRAVRAGQLSLLGLRTATEGGQRLRGWQLDLEHPWKRATAVAPRAPGDRALRFRRSEREPASTRQDPASAVQPKAASVRPPSEDALPVAEARVAVVSPQEARSGIIERPAEVSAASVRSAGVSGEVGDPPASVHRYGLALKALVEVRRARAAAQSGSAGARCQSALALAMTLLQARRPEEALLEALDALARALESRDAKATLACKALLAKLYAAAGHGKEASALLEARLTRGLPDT